MLHLMQVKEVFITFYTHLSLQYLRIKLVLAITKCFLLHLPYKTDITVHIKKV